MKMALKEAEAKKAYCGRCKYRRFMRAVVIINE